MVGGITSVARERSVYTDYITLAGNIGERRIIVSVGRSLLQRRVIDQYTDAQTLRPADENRAYMSGTDDAESDV